jgi:hypothetical protein
VKILENSINNLSKVFKQALNYLHFSESSISEALGNQELLSVANIVKSFGFQSIIQKSFEKNYTIR